MYDSTITKYKIDLFNMNLNYPLPYFKISAEEYTNWLINQQMNYFNNNFTQDADKTFILDYKDDLISIICYRMLKNLQATCSFNFEIFINGKIKKTKSQMSKGYKKISNWKMSKLLKSNSCIIIQGSNLLYNVVFNTGIFKEFPCKVWRPFEHFTPEQIEIAQIFYHIGYIKGDAIQFTDERIKEFKKYCNRQITSYAMHYSYYYKKDIALIQLTCDNDVDMETLNKVEDFDGLIFYFLPENVSDPSSSLLSSEFGLFVKNKANIPDQYNIDNFETPDDLIHNYNAYPTFFGPWSDEDRAGWRK